MLMKIYFWDDDETNLKGCISQSLARGFSRRTVRAYTLSRGIRRSVSAAVLVREY